MTTSNDFEVKIEQKTEAEKGKPVVDEYEQAGIAFNQHYKIYKQVAYNMRKKKSVVRVLEHILFSPAIDVELFGQEEKDLLAICANVFKNKIKLMEYTAQRMAEEKQLAEELEEENSNVKEKK